MEAHYATLGLDVTSSQTQVKRAFRALALRLHPDRNPDGIEQFKKVVLAYETITTNRTTRGSQSTASRDSSSTTDRPRASSFSHPPSSSTFTGNGGPGANDSKEKIERDRHRAKQNRRVPLSAYDPTDVADDDDSMADFLAQMQQFFKMEATKQRMTSTGATKTNGDVDRGQGGCSPSDAWPAPQRSAQAGRPDEANSKGVFVDTSITKQFSSTRSVAAQMASAHTPVTTEEFEHELQSMRRKADAHFTMDKERQDMEREARRRRIEDETRREWEAEQQRMDDLRAQEALEKAEKEFKARLAAEEELQRRKQQQSTYATTNGARSGDQPSTGEVGSGASDRLPVPRPKRHTAPISSNNGSPGAAPMVGSTVLREAAKQRREQKREQLRKGLPTQAAINGMSEGELFELQALLNERTRWVGEAEKARSKRCASCGEMEDPSSAPMRGYSCGRCSHRCMCSVCAEMCEACPVCGA